MQNATHSKGKNNWQKVGKGASIACAIHCAATPLFLLFFPFMGTSADLAGWHALEPFLIFTGVTIGGFFLFKNWPLNRKNALRFFLFFVGVLFLGLSLVYEESEIHLLPSIAGALLVAGSQFHFNFGKKSDCPSACTHSHAEAGGAGSAHQ